MRAGTPTIVVLVAVHNRRDRTSNCISSVSRAAYNAGVGLQWRVFDDGSTDGTAELLDKVLDSSKDRVLIGDGTNFWARSMRKLMDSVLAHDDLTMESAILLINDDIDMFDSGISTLLKGIDEHDIAVGSTIDMHDGHLTYGGYLRRDTGLRRLTFDLIRSRQDQLCDTFNANCVLLRAGTLRTVGSFDDHWIHSLADFDFGLRAGRKGLTALSLGEPVATCARNPLEERWDVKGTSLRERWRRMESPKGSPIRQWARFSMRHGGPAAPLYILNQYRRLMLPRGAREIDRAQRGARN